LDRHYRSWFSEKISSGLDLAAASTRQFRCAPLPAGYAKRYAARGPGHRRAKKKGAPAMDAASIGFYAEIVDILVKLTVLFGVGWGVYKFVHYRELKQRIQLELDANMHELTSPELTEAFSWDEEGNRETVPAQSHTHALEILLKFTNKGFRRMRLYNIQIGVNTMRPQNQAQFDPDDGHLKLTRVFTSGNIVPLFRVKDKAVEKSSFYYIEPGVEQTISYLTLVTEPRELVQIYARFSLEQKRIFPQKAVGQKRIYPATAARTYKLNSDGSMIE
jgi:hypothetical protein